MHGMYTQEHKRAGTQNRTHLRTSARAHNALTLACVPRLHYAETSETGGDDLENLKRGVSHSWKTLYCVARGIPHMVLVYDTPYMLYAENGIENYVKEVEGIIGSVRSASRREITRERRASRTNMIERTQHNSDIAVGGKDAPIDVV